MKRAIFSAILCALLVGALAFALVLASFVRPRLATRWLHARPYAGWLNAPSSNAEIVTQANQAVVTVIATRATRAAQASSGEPIISQQNEGNTVPNPHQAERNVQRGTGTGFVIDAAGFIVTNDHVISGADRIRVRLTDGREYRATVFGADPATDIALLKIEAENLPALPLGDSDEVRVGDAVIAIGNPLDYEHSVTSGIVSAKGRKVYHNEPFEDFIQTDAAINRGNSGGPLLNQQGEVIGVNTVIRVDGSGISFAVPSNVVKRVIGQLRLNRTVVRGYLGLTAANLTQELRDGLGVGNLQGILVADLAQDKPAARAGVEAYDVITHFDGKPVTTTDDFYVRVANTPPPQPIELTIVRNGQRLKLTATPEERHKNEAERAPERPATAKNGSLLGFTVREETAESLRALRVSETSPDAAGVVVVAELDPLGPAAESGLAVGQIIVEANRQPVRNQADFSRVTSSLREGQVLILRVSSPHERVLRLVAIRLG
jgi:Do/DeqQ family serine protease